MSSLNGQAKDILGNETSFDSFIQSIGFRICHKRTIPKRDARTSFYNNAGLSTSSLNFLKERKIFALWTHQLNAINEAKEGHNVCITTSTSSGKTEIFQVSAIEALEKSPKAKVLAVYPMKALNRQQVERWEKTGYTVGKIDGDNSDMEHRRATLTNNRIVVMTPDVIHSFLLGRLNDSGVGDTIKSFIKDVTLIIIDELHLYKGVFGTNSAYLFRRLNHIWKMLRKDDDFPQYITASATLPNATKHSFNITGANDFVEIGIEQDASPIAEKTFYYVDVADVPKNDGSDLVSQLIISLAQINGTKTITFVEGRQRTGEMALYSDPQSGIFPYRAGYETETVDRITESLHKGEFKGVISTSALEIGIDIDGLNVAIIADMPHDKNSYQQRIGRVGRFGCNKSYVIIVRTASFTSQLLFDKFNYDIDKVLPDYEPALYLEDESVQNIHALCHVGDHDYCEYNQWKGKVTQVRSFEYTDCFPSSFSKLCMEILSGQTTRSYDDIQSNSPHYDYPLRFFGKQYDIVAANGEKNYIPRERISREMLATEGYKGAIRNTMLGKTPIKERVMKVENIKGEIFVKREYNMFLTTKAKHSKILVPNFKKEYRHSTIYYKDTKIYNLRVKEFHNIYGYSEKKNGKNVYNKYEHVFQMPVLTTTGTVIFHPSFNNPGVKISDIAQILFETFLQRNAFDRNDIAHIGNTLFYSNDELKAKNKFIALYDINPLNITSRIIDDALLKDLFNYLYQYGDIIVPTICPDVNQETQNALNDLCKSIIENNADVSYKDTGCEYFFKVPTEVLYQKEKDDDSDEYENILATYVGKGRGENTCNIMLVDGTFMIDIPLDRISTTEKTEYIRID